MILDNELIFAYNQSLATGNSEKTIDLSSFGDALAEELYFVAVLGTAASGGTNVKLDLETSAAEGFSSAETLYTVTVPTAKLKAGTTLAAVKMPRGAKRYLRVKVTTDTSAGTYSAFLNGGDQHGWETFGK